MFLYVTAGYYHTGSALPMGLLLESRKFILSNTF